MWYDILSDNVFIKKLYNKVPELTDVRIFEMNIQNEGNKISITFDLPYYADYPPQKWINLKHNTVIVRVDFFLIHELNMQASSYDFFRGNIEMFLDENKLVNVKISGSLKANFIANSGLIQYVKAYQIAPPPGES